MPKDPIKEYLKYIYKLGDRFGVYQMIAQTYQINRALYPGSHIDIAPSLYIPQVTYIDNNKTAPKFFKQMDTIYEYLNQNKKYKQPCQLAFLDQDYSLPLNVEAYDLIISLYAGFVGQATKAYLKDDGILLCNDSHGDATLAYFDPDYQLIGIAKYAKKQWSIKNRTLEKYFKLSNNRTPDLDKVLSTMKGPKYLAKEEYYLFKKTPSK
jgi:hypothetical protein